MNKIIDELLAMEKSARETAADTDDTRVDIQYRIHEEVSRGKDALRRQADARIAEIQHDAREETEIRLNRIRAEYEAKAKAAETAFAVHREAWRARIIRDVLYGLHGDGA
jgi:hypothetical protein